MIFRSPYSRLLLAGASLLFAGSLAAVAAVTPSQINLLSQPSGTSSGIQGDGPSLGPVSMTHSGRIVAFSSFARNFFGLDSNNREDIFIRDQASNFTGIVSLGNPTGGSQTQNPRQLANGDSSNPSISPSDGRFVAFQSRADNLVTGDTNTASDVFVRDRFGDVIRASVDGNGLQGPNNAGSFNPSISDSKFDANLGGDRVVVAYQSDANNLDGTENPDNTASDVFATTIGPGFFIGGLQIEDTTRISVAEDGSPGDGASANPSISADGRFVVFESLATNLTGDATNGFSNIFLADVQAGTVEMISGIRDDTGAVVTDSDGDSHLPYISPNGRYIAFVTDATIFDNTDSGNFADVVVYDRVLNIFQRVSVDSLGNEGSDDSGVIGGNVDPTGRPTVTDDGHFVTFTSAADDLTADDGNGFLDVFVHDTQTGETQRVSAGPTLGEDGDSTAGFISGDGSSIAFASDADNLIQDDNNFFSDVFAIDTGQVGGGGANVPTADAGPDLLASEADTVFLDGTASFDPEGDPLTYKWTQEDTGAPLVTLDDDTSPTPSFVAPPVSEPTVLTFSLVVSDGVNTSDPDEVDILVNEAAPATVFGHVQDDQGNPIVGASVQVVREVDGAEAPLVETDGAGDFTVPEVRAGDNIISITAPGFEPYVSDSTPVAGGDNLDLGDISLVGPTASIGGTVRFQNQQPVEGALVSLIGTDGEVIAESNTDEAGEYLLEDLDSFELADASSITVETKGLPTWTTSSFPKEEGVLNPKDFTYGKLQVTVDAMKAANRKFLNGTTVSVKQGTLTLISEQATAKKRTVVFPNLPAGSFKVQASNAKLGAASTSVNIPEGGTLKVTLKIAPVRF